MSWIKDVKEKLMKDKSRLFILILALILPLACNLFPTPTPEGPCLATAGSHITAYQRPSLLAQVFGDMSSGLQVEVLAQTSDDWLGFDPGVAQAGNIGIFRLRWIESSSDIALTGDCESVPIVVGPPPGVCFTMAMGEIDVHLHPDAESDLIATMDVEDYAAVEGVTADNWARVDLSLGNLGVDIQGWIPGSALNMNGPCDDLPVIEP
jgi:hypothetical protein